MKQTIRVLTIHRSEISLNDIKYVQGSGNYSILHLVNSKLVILGRSLMKLQDELSAFICIHKGYLVNPKFITSNQPLSKTKLRVTLSTGEVLVVARRRMPYLAAVLA